jgi:DNA polymerase
MHQLVFLDWETRYEVGKYSIVGMGAQAYLLDDRFEAIGVAIQWPEDDLPKWYTDGDIDVQMDRLRREQDHTIVIQHNATFDGSILAWHYDVHPAELVCTIAMARSLGLSLVGGLSLDSLAEQAIEQGYPLPHKGKEVIYASGKRRRDFTATELASYGRYCIDDTRICKALFDIFIQHLAPAEMVFQSQVLRMYTERNLTIHRPTVEAELLRVRERRDAALDLVCERLGVQDKALLLQVVGSNPKMAEALELFGAEVPMKRSKADPNKQTFAFAKTDPGLLDLLNHSVPEVAALVEARLGLKSSIEETRCETFLELEKMGPLPVPLNVSAAHTHRLGGSGSWNPQNLPSGRKTGQSKALKVSLNALPGYVLSGGDSSQVEVRVMAYIANDEQVLEDFRQGRCPYSTMALSLWPDPALTAGDVKKLAKSGDKVWKHRRQTAKTVLLGSQFGIGVKAFRDYAKVNEGMDLTWKESKVYVHGYRNARPATTRLWKTCDRVLHLLADGKGVEFGGPNGRLFVADPDHKVLGHKLPSIILPDGMRLHFPELEFVDVKEWVDIIDDDTGAVLGREEQVRNKARFWTKKGKANIPNFTHGPKISENIVQAGAFAAMKFQAGLLEYPLVFQEHDAHYVTSTIEQAPHALANLRWAMSQPPPWAPELPLSCEAGQAGSLGDLVKQ